MIRSRISLFCAILLLSLVPIGCTKTIVVSAVHLSEESLTLKVGETSRLVALVEPAMAEYETVVWSSSDPSVATVENGMVKVHKLGTARIAAFVGGVSSEVCVVTVVEDQVQESEPVMDHPSATSGTKGSSDEPEGVSESAEDGASDEAESVSDGTEAASEDTEGVSEDTDDTSEVTEGDSEVAEDDSEGTDGVSEEIEGTAEDSEGSSEDSEGSSEDIDDAPEGSGTIPGDTDDNVTEVAEEEETPGYRFVYDVDFGREGSYIDIGDLITIKDWRGEDFKDNPSYWDYYGPVVITADLANAECDLGGTRQPLPQKVTIIQVEPGQTTAEDPSSGAKVTLPESKFGYLMCKFTTVVLTEGFNIYVKIKVKYGFGTVQTDWIKIPVVVEYP